MHKPVLVQEVIHALHLQPHKTYLDVTFGSGGHTRALLQADATINVIALDWDTNALETFGVPLQEEFGQRLRLIWGNFAHLYKIIKKEHIGPFAGVLADFGTSQGQLLQAAGFSFHHDSPLDMRMSPSHQKVTASDIINKASEDKLAEIFFQLGEERASRRIARAIVAERTRKRFTSTLQLAQLVESLTPVFMRKRGTHPATKVFQALRIYINHELDNIHAFLPAALQALEPEGRLVCISFHSLEDRLVKQFFADQVSLGKGVLATKGAVVGTDEEIAQNPSARSAKLRALSRV